MELLQVVPSCVASADDAGETDKEYVTVKIRKKCKNLHSLILNVGIFGNSRVVAGVHLTVNVECHYIHDWGRDGGPKGT